MTLSNNFGSGGIRMFQGSSNPGWSLYHSPALYLLKVEDVKYFDDVMYLKKKNKQTNENCLQTDKSMATKVL